MSSVYKRVYIVKMSTLHNKQTSSLCKYSSRFYKGGCY